MEATEYDVLICYSRPDGDAVEQIASRLRARGINVWLDTWNLIPGEPWIAYWEKALQNSKSCAVFLGPTGRSPWQNQELRSAILEASSGRRGTFRVIPVLLPGANGDELRGFFNTAHHVSFRDLDDANALHMLIAGIRGVAPMAAELVAPLPDAIPIPRNDPIAGVPSFQQSHTSHQIFISYATEDRTIAEDVRSRFEASHIPCWMAPDDIEEGTAYAAAIYTALKTARRVVLIFSEHSNISPDVSREIQLASRFKVPVILLRIAPLEQDDVSPALAYYVSGLHWFDAVGGQLHARLDALVKKTAGTLERR